ncbi:Dipeptidase [invertebrate metagenome]|uniref:membrane dipeptidase n=1 Tax=invertebrate metagenome TaxID=1711999 RepID=A0A2H9T6W8_9ZZZZ
MSPFQKSALSLCISVTLFTPLLAEACTSVIAGKDASASGALVLSRNEDFSSNNWAKHLAIYPAVQYKAGDMLTLSNGLKVPAPAKSLRYTAVQDWNAMTVSNDGKVFEERGVNELNVAMSATNSAEIDPRANKADPLVGMGIIEENMTGLILSQATSARDAVQRLGDYVTKYGSGETTGVQFADTKEAWYMEIGSGHHWMAVRVPDDQYVVVANGLRIHGVDLNDTDNVMHSKGLWDFVKTNKLLKNPDTGNFNFAMAFGKTGDVYNTDREWLSQKMLTPSLKQRPRQQQYPLFLKPDHKIRMTDIASVLRADYRGTELNGKAERPNGVDRNSEAHIIEMYPDMPKELAALIWQTPSNVKYSPFIPLFNVMKTVPAAYTKGTDQYDASSAWWVFRELGTLSSKSVNKSKYQPAVSRLLATTEANLEQSQSYLNTMLKQLYQKDQKAAIAFASDYSNGLLQSNYDKAVKLRADIMTDLTRSTEKKYSPEEFKKIQSL